MSHFANACALPQSAVRLTPSSFSTSHSHFPGKKDLTLLTREDCRAYAEDSHRKDGELKAAYKIGANPDEWLEETDRIVREAEKARVQEELEAQENEDQLQDEEANGGDEQSSTTAKKRSAGDAGTKASASKAKKAKTEKKSGSAAPRKSVGVADDDAADVSGAGENDDPMKKVRNWRHSLQRAFLPKDREPTAQVSIRLRALSCLTRMNTDLLRVILDYASGPRAARRHVHDCGKGRHYCRPIARNQNQQSHAQDHRSREDSPG